MEKIELNFGVTIGINKTEYGTFTELDNNLPTNKYMRLRQVL